MIVNRVLHVWSAPLTWLVGARIDQSPHPMLSVEYAYWMRYGPQSVTVRAPITAQDEAVARDVLSLIG